MLTALSDILKKAKENQYGVPAFSVINEATCFAAIEAAEKAKSPLILLCGLIYDGELGDFMRHINELCQRTDVPVSIIRDHAGTFEEAVVAVQKGFNAVMLDKSKLSYEENCKELKEFVKIAHACNVEVEAELGHVGAGTEDKSVFTIPEEAVNYVNETDVDFLAVAIGTSHGIYRGTPKLNFELLDELNSKISVPLVLHGSSGTGDDNISKACQKGICKVNVATDLFIAARDSVLNEDLSDAKVYGVYNALKKGYVEEALKWMKICGSINRI